MEFSVAAGRRRAEVFLRLPAGRRASGVFAGPPTGAWIRVGRVEIALEISTTASRRHDARPGGQGVMSLIQWFGPLCAFSFLLATAVERPADNFWRAATAHAAAHDLYGRVQMTIRAQVIYVRAPTSLVRSAHAHSAGWPADPHVETLADNPPAAKLRSVEPQKIKRTHS
jgi:hypothetical protein